MNSLYLLDINAAVIVESLLVNQDSKVRLSEMGVMPGTIVRLVRRTPFGGPVLLKVNNYYLSIRKEDALLIKVKNYDKT